MNPVIKGTHQRDGYVETRSMHPSPWFPLVTQPPSPWSGDRHTQMMLAGKAT